MNCSGSDPDGAIEIYAEHVLPELRAARKSRRAESSPRR
jgi:hypothetical protein